MRQVDTIVEMLSERRKGSKLKRISISHCDESHPFPNLSEVRFIFEGDESDGANEERVIMIWGKDLGVGFGLEEGEGKITSKKEDPYGFL